MKALHIILLLSFPSQVVSYLISDQIMVMALQFLAEILMFSLLLHMQMSLKAV